MADTLGSVGVIISTLLIQRFGWTGFDPLASIAIAALIFASVVPLVRDSMNMLLLRLSDRSQAEVRMTIDEISQSVECMVAINKVQFWPITESQIVGIVHILVDPERATSLDEQPQCPIDVRDSACQKIQAISRANIGGLRDVFVSVDFVQTAAASLQSDTKVVPKEAKKSKDKKSKKSSQGGEAESSKTKKSKSKSEDKKDKKPKDKSSKKRKSEVQDSDDDHDDGEKKKKSKKDKKDNKDKKSKDKKQKKDKKAKESSASDSGSSSSDGEDKDNGGSSKTPAAASGWNNWMAADLGSKERTDKFLRLMGVRNVKD
ncbi:putative zinc transporter msc2, partial [Coemansia sp. RSA 2703]